MYSTSIQNAEIATAPLLTHPAPIKDSGHGGRALPIRSNNERRFPRGEID
jgi:hypothetical protein